LEGDSARRLNSARGRDDYPTLIIESGNTQSWGSLKSKARLFRAVRIVVLVKISDESNCIKLEKWVPNIPPHPVTRSQGTTHVGTCIDQIHITQIEGSDPSNPASYRVEGGPLNLEFDELMLRPPRTGEGNIVITEARLRSYAANFWSSMSQRMVHDKGYRASEEIICTAFSSTSSTRSSLMGLPSLLSEV